MTDRRHAIEKARAMVERAAHEATPEEEARTAGVLAARFILSEGLLDDAPARPSPPSSGGWRTPPPQSSGFRTPWRGDPGSYVRSPFGPSPFGSSPFGSPPPIPTPPNPVQELLKTIMSFATSLQAVLKVRKLGLAEREGTCSVCEGPYAAGDVVGWRRRRANAAHYKCCIEEIAKG